MKKKIIRLLEALYHLTFEVGDNAYSTFGYYPEDDAAEAQLMAHAADPAMRAAGEDRLRKMAAGQRAASQGSFR